MLRDLLKRKQFETELSAELQDHLTKYADDLVAQGVPREEAILRARREFGAVAKIQDEVRDSSGLHWPDACLRNLRYAVRMLRKNPVFSATVILTLSLCIGANTAIFSVVDAMLFRPLAYPSPERLGNVTSYVREPGASYYETSVDGKVGDYLRTNLKSLDVALHSQTTGVNLVPQGGEARYVDQQRVSTGFFRVLGVAPMLGREIDPSEDVSGGPAVAVLGEPLWRSSFGGDPAIVGKAILLRGEQYRVIGVMPAGFNSPLKAEVWTPLRPSTKGEGSGANYGAIARVRDGFTFTQADAELAAANAREIAMPGMFGPKVDPRFELVSIQKALSDQTREPALLLWAAVGLVLLIGCLNVTGLLLARAVTRRREMATRLALGSTRGGLAGQLMVESLVLAIGGGVGGVLLGRIALNVLNPATSKALGLFRPAVVDWRVMALTAVLVLLTCAVFGLFPALTATRSDLRSALAGSGRTSSARRGSWARWGLVLTEVALAMILLVGAGFATRTFTQFLNKSPGYDGQGVFAAGISLQDARYTNAPQIDRLFTDSLREIRQYPGVETAGVGLTLPYQRPLNSGLRVMDGPNAMQESRIANLTYVTPGYLEALRIGLLRGRLLQDSDRDGAPLAAVVNEAYLRYYMKTDTEPVGRHLALVRPYEIVGVVADVLHERGWGPFGPIAGMPQVYVPAAQLPGPSFVLFHTWFSPHWVVRSTLSRSEVSAAVKTAVTKVDSQLPLAEVRSMDEIRAGAFAKQRLAAELLGLLAALSLVLASLGVYGLISGQVADRTREFGIRLALGASRRETVLRTVRSGVVLAALGVVAGYGLSRPAMRYLESPTEQWRQIHADDPRTLFGVAGILLAVAATASLIPSLRIVRIDPARTLRED